ncbi:uncharacterized protein LOC111705667 [Eurytemora carolleeae]|uniref:uncharacterized protein LOC111705667 n=1 Tax=Eurytemora carolleeae TaxID=1294199 RepID=UPI000C779B3C|nr:uncharacterized protein LOC111705667 [Eurytemora carolleeae]|eukprot:XP_023334058.1 uncharacterized protein LOC111705667 [Eurytemora affinis]
MFSIGIKLALGLLCLIPISLACLGDGCIYDKMENRFFWISDRAKSEIESVKDHGGPKAYCNALGLAVTDRGNSLWMRAEDLQKNAEMYEQNTKPAYSSKTICHEMIWN